jgi:hypothetical protein
MGGARRAHGGDGKCVKNYWLASIKGKHHSEDITIDERVVFTCISGKYG